MGMSSARRASIHGHRGIGLHGAAARLAGHLNAEMVLSQLPHGVDEALVAGVEAQVGRDGAPPRCLGIVPALELKVAKGRAVVVVKVDGNLKVGRGGSQGGVSYKTHRRHGAMLGRRGAAPSPSKRCRCSSDHRRTCVVVVVVVVGECCEW